MTSRTRDSIPHPTEPVVTLFRVEKGETYMMSLDVLGHNRGAGCPQVEAPASGLYVAIGGRAAIISVEDLEGAGFIPRL